MAGGGRRKGKKKGVTLHVDELQSLYAAQVRAVCRLSGAYWECQGASSGVSPANGYACCIYQVTHVLQCVLWLSSPSPATVLDTSTGSPACYCASILPFSGQEGIRTRLLLP